MPVPHEGPPGQTLGMLTPHATVSGEVAGHIGMHTQRPPVHACPEGHRVPVPHEGPPGQLFGMDVPHATVSGEVAGHEGTHMQLPPTHV